MLFGGKFKPVLAFERVLIFRCFPGRGEPVGALPARSLAEAGIVQGQSLMQRGMADAARGLHLPVRIVVVIQKAERFGDPAL